VVPRGEALASALEDARILARSAPLVVQTLKRFANETLNRSPAETAALARDRLLTVRDSDDGAEGRRAFAEKRDPQFRGR
jgi:enoyl-CoA hydratase/carnithine racemase